MATPSFSKPAWDVGFGGGKTPAEQVRGLLKEIEERRKKEAAERKEPPKRERSTYIPTRDKTPAVAEPDVPAPSKEVDKAPLATPTPYVPPAEDDDEEAPRPERKEASRSQWFRDLGYPEMGQQPTFDGTLRYNLETPTVSYGGPPSPTVVPATAPVGPQNYEIEQDGPPAPARDLFSPYNTFLGASNPQMTLVSSPTSAMPVMPALTSVALEGLNVGADKAFNNVVGPAGITPGQAARESLGAMGSAVTNMMGPFAGYMRGYLQSGSLGRAKEQRMDDIAAAREWTPEDVEIIPIRERNTILAKEPGERSFREWLGLAMSTPAPNRGGSSYERALYYDDKMQKAGEQSVRVVAANAMFAWDFVTDANARYASLELTPQDWYHLFDTGEVPDPEDRGTEATFMNRGLLQPAVNAGSTLWRGLRAGWVPGESPEALEVYGPNNGITWVGMGRDPEKTRFAAFRDDMSSLADASLAVRNYVASKVDSPEEFETYQNTLGFFASDAYRVQRMIDDVATFEAQKAELYAEMQAAKARGDTSVAGALQRRLSIEEQKSHIDIMNNRASIGGELAYSLVFDAANLLNPVNKVLGFGEAARAYDEAYMAARYARKYGADAFKPIIDGIDDVVEGLANGQVFTRARGGGVRPVAKVGRGDNVFNIIKDNLSPFARTPETMANKDVHTIHTTIVPLIKDLEDTTDIMTVLKALAEDPTSLRRGLSGLLPTSSGVAEDGIWYPANAFFTSKDFQDSWATLNAAWPEIARMAEWSKDVPDKLKIIVGMDSILLGTGRRMYGAVPSSAIPATAKAFERVGMDIIFKDGTGKGAAEIARVTAEDLSEAKRWEREFQKAIDVGNGDFEAGQFLLDIIGLQKTWLSNQNLNLDPGHWVRNATNATLALMGDETYAWKSLAQQENDLVRIMGEIPMSTDLFRLFGIEEGAEAIQQGIPTWMRPTQRTKAGKWLGKYIVNPISGFGLAERGSRVWTEAHVGKSTLAGGGELGPEVGGRSLKFSEEAYRNSAFYSAFMKAMRKSWKQMVGSSFVNPLVDSGISPDKAKQMGNYVASLYASGKQNILRKAQETLRDNELPFSVNMDRYQDILDADQLDRLHQFMRALPGDDEAVANSMINQFIARMKVDAGTSFRKAPTQPGNTQFFDKDVVDDAHTFLDDFTRMMRDPNTGVTPEVKRQMTAQVNQARDDMLEGLEGLATDLAQVGDEGGLTHMVDVMWEWHKKRADWLIDKDNIYEAAGQAATDAAWNKARQDVLARWEQYTEDVIGMFGKARQDLFTPGAMPDQPSSLNQIMLRLSSFDEVVNQQMREAGRAIRNVGREYETFTEARGANRELLNYGLSQMFDAYKQYPSMDGFNTMADVMIKIDDGGARLARHLQDLADMATSGELPGPLYQRYYNSAWNQYFDQMYDYIHAASGYVLESGLYKKADKMNVNQVKQVGRTVDEFMENMQQGQPLMTRMPTFEADFVPTNEDFYTWAETIGIPTVKNDGKSRTLSGVARWVRENFPDIDMTNKRGIRHLTDEEKRTVFARMVEQFNLGDLQFFSKSPNQDLRKMLFDINKASQNVQGNKAYDWADVFTSTNRTYDMLRDDMWDMYKTWQTGGMDDVRHISPQEAVVMNDALRRTLDTYNDAISMASHVGQRMADFALLDYNDRRRIDTMVSVVWPYHYFWTRSAKNWAIRLMDNPRFTNALMAYQDAKYLENQQSDVLGTFREGTVPSPFNSLTGRNDRISDIVEYALPNYGPSPFVKPDQANNAWEQKVDSARQFLPGIGPAGQLIMDAAWDASFPVEDGPSRLSQYEFGDWHPVARLLHYGTMWARGEQIPWTEKITGDKWDHYRIANEVSAGVTSKEDEYLAGVMGEVMENRQQGRDDYYGIDEELIPEIEQRLSTATAAAGRNRFIPLITSTLLGATYYPADEHKNDMYRAQEEYWQGQYSPETTGGSTAYQREVAEENPNMTAKWNMASLKPGAGPEVKTPLQRAEEGVAWDEFTEASQALQDKRAELLADSPYMTEPDMWDATKAERERVQAAADNLPESQLDPAERELKGNPTEKATTVFKGVLNSSRELYPYPESPWPSDEEAAAGAEGPSQAEKLEYWQARGQAEVMQEKHIVSRLTWMVENDGFLTQNFSGTDREWWNEMKNILQGRSVQDWVDMYYGRYDSDSYFRWKQAWDLRSDAEQAIRDENRAFLEGLVGEQFTQEELAIFDEYLAMDKETDDEIAARREFSEDNPFISEMNAALYNNDEYASAVHTWGPDWFEVQQGIPDNFSMFGKEWDSLTEAEKDQVFDAKDAYLAQFPLSNEIRFWYSGRSLPEETRDELERLGKEMMGRKQYVPKSWGEEYNEAVDLFGEDVFQVEREMAQVDGQAFYRWRDANEARYINYLGYKSWKGFLRSEAAGDPQEMAYEILTDIAISERDAIMEAAMVAETSETILIPGTPTSAPNYWRGVPLPGVGLLGAEGTVGALPPEVAQELGDQPVVSGSYVTPDPEQVLDPKVANVFIPGTSVKMKDVVSTPMGAAESMDSTMPGLGLMGEMLDAETKDILEAGKGGLPEAPTTLEELLKTSDTYKKLISSKAKWAKYEADAYLKQEFASSAFGVDPKTWNMYFDLPRGSDARKALKDSDPALEAGLLFAWNQDKWPSAQDAGFTAQDVTLWAQRPDYDPDKTEPRTEFFRANPRAFLFNSWVNGKYSGKDSDEPDYSRDWGADYREAQERFGGDIWGLVVQYRNLPSNTGARSRFRRENPRFGKWNDWWYSNLSGSSDYIYRTKYAGSSYGGSWGGRSWGGGGGGGGSWSDTHDTKFPDGGVYVSPYRQPNMPQTPRWSNPISATSDNWRRYASPSSRLMQWNRRLGS